MAKLSPIGHPTVLSISAIIYVFVAFALSAPSLNHYSVSHIL